MKNKPPYPNKPYEPRKPNRQSYVLAGAKVKKVIYRDIKANNDSIDLEEYFKDRKEELPNIPEKRYWQNLSLQDIINLLPPNTDLSNVIFNIKMPRYLEYTDVSFTLYERDYDLEEKKYQDYVNYYNEEMKKYQKDLLKYEEDLKKYNEFMQEEEIKQKELELQNLKNKLKK